MSPLYEQNSVFNPSHGNTHLPQHPPLPSPSSLLPSKCSRLRPLELRIWAFCGGCQTNDPLVPRAKDATDVVVPIFRAAARLALRKPDRRSGLGLLNRGSEYLSSSQYGLSLCDLTYILFTSVLDANGCYGDERPPYPFGSLLFPQEANTKTVA